jgi:hypothetical protein
MDVIPLSTVTTLLGLPLKKTMTFFISHLVGCYLLKHLLCEGEGDQDGAKIFVWPSGLSANVIVDLQKMHLAPYGFFSDTSKIDVLYWEP